MKEQVCVNIGDSQMLKSASLYVSFADGIILWHVGLHKEWRLSGNYL